MKHPNMSVKWLRRCLIATTTMLLIYFVSILCSLNPIALFWNSDAIVFSCDGRVKHIVEYKGRLYIYINRQSESEIVSLDIDSNKVLNTMKMNMPVQNCISCIDNISIFSIKSINEHSIVFVNMDTNTLTLQPFPGGSDIDIAVPIGKNHAVITKDHWVHIFTHAGHAFIRSHFIPELRASDDILIYSISSDNKLALSYKSGMEISLSHDEGGNIQCDGVSRVGKGISSIYSRLSNADSKTIHTNGNVVYDRVGGVFMIEGSNIVNSISNQEMYATVSFIKGELLALALASNRELYYSATNGKIYRVNSARYCKR